MLTIAVPTYGRNETLKRTLAGVLPQITAECRLLILDNFSPTPVEETLRPLLAQWSGVKCKIVRHRANLGATANILRAFELCETEWLWTLGDDDVLCSDAIATVREEICAHPEAVYFNFLARGGTESGGRRSRVVANGVTEFIEKVDYVHGINFMSCSVWRTQAFLPVAKHAYHYTYSMGWSLALLLFGLGRQERVVLSNQAIIAQASIAPIELRWSYREFIVGWPLLLEIPVEKGVRRLFCRKMLSVHSPENVVAYLLGVAGVSAKERVFYYKLAAARVCPYRIYFLGQLRFLAYRPLFWAPALGWRLVRSAIRFANKLGLKHIDIADIEGRQSVSL